MTPTEKGNPINLMIAWISDMGKKGYFPKGTVGNRVRAIRNVEAILEEDEKRNLKELFEKAETVADRWGTRTNAAPTSIQSTKSHLRGLLQDYLRYLDNPGTFARAQGTPRAKKAETAGTKKPRPKPKTTTSIAHDDKLDALKEKTPAININIQINIPTDAPDTQIDKIFESMAKHIYKKQTE